MQHEGFLSPTIRRWRLRQCVRFLPNVAGIRLLDVGCGQGKLIEFLPPDVHYSGIERDEYAVAQLRHKYPRHSFFVRDLEYEKIGLGEDTFHVVVLLALLEQLHNGEQVLQVLRNHLEPDGRLIATTLRGVTESIGWVAGWGFLAAMQPKSTVPYMIGFHY